MVSHIQAQVEPHLTSFMFRYPPVFISLNREPATPVAGETLKALGHGTIYSGGPLGVNLMEVDLPALSTTQCMNFVGPYGSYGSSVNHPSMMCAGNGTGFDTCTYRAYSEKTPSNAIILNTCNTTISNANRPRRLWRPSGGEARRQMGPSR